MIGIFDLEKLHALLEDFYRITRIRITVFDGELRELTSYPEQVAPVCRLIRSYSGGLDACLACDKAACAVAMQKGRTHIYRCHAGLTEAVTPVYAGGALVGYLLFGHVFSYEDRQTGLQNICAACKGLPIDKAALEATLEESPLIPYDFVRSTTHILHAVASYLVLERMAILKEDEPTARLDAYLATHFTQKCTADVLCADLGIGKTQLFKLARRLYPEGLSGHVRRLRLEKARELLYDHPGLSITQVAEQCGFTDYNYFIAVFSKEMRLSPSAYRKQAKFS